MSTNLTVIPTRINKTAAAWAADAVAHSANKILVTTNAFYTNGHQKVKFANGIDAWSALPYLDADTVVAMNMANADLTLTGNRVHDASGNNWALTDLHQLKFESTSTTVAGAMVFQFNPGGTTTDIFTSWTVDAGSLPAFQIIGNKNVGIGDAAQSNIRLQVYGAGMSTGVNVVIDTSASTAIAGSSNGANGFGGKFTCQVSGGVGVTGLGDAVGFEGKVIGTNGTSVVGRGKALITDYSDTSARADSAALDVRSTTGGALLPRMTRIERLALSPAEWLIVYQTNTVGTSPAGEYVYSPVAGTWKYMSTAAHIVAVIPSLSTDYQNDQLIGGVVDLIFVGGLYIDPTAGLYTFDDSTGTLTYTAGFAAGEVLFLLFH